ncbi:MAG: hypothetical protein ACRD16_02175 [Thermoanaerobaculia bacterium]
MPAALAFVAYRGRPLESRELATILHEEASRLATAGGTLAVRQVANVAISSLFPNKQLDPGEVHFLSLSIAGTASALPGPTPGEAGLPDGEGLGVPIWSDVLAVHVSRAAGAALTIFLDDGQQVGYYAIFVRGERLRSTWLAANRRRVEIVETRVEAAKPAPEAQGGEPYVQVPLTGVELLLGEGIRGASGKPAVGFAEQLYEAVFEAGRPVSRWIVARDGRFLDEPQALPEEQAKGLRLVF